MEPSKGYTFTPHGQQNNPIEMVGMSVHPVGSVQRGNDAISVTLRTNLTASKVFQTVSTPNSKIGNIAALSVKNLCEARGLTGEQLKEVLIDSINSEAYLFTANEVLKVAVNNAFKTGNCKAEDYEVVFQGTKDEFLRHKLDLQADLQESMNHSNYPKFISLLANPLISFSKEEVRTFMQNHRHELGKAVVECRELGEKGASPQASGIFLPLTRGDQTIFYAQKGEITKIAEGVRVYELRADPKDPNSPLIGYCRITKNEINHRKQGASSVETFESIFDDDEGGDDVNVKSLSTEQTIEPPLSHDEIFE